MTLFKDTQGRIHTLISCNLAYTWLKDDAGAMVQISNQYFNQIFTGV